MRLMLSDDDEQTQDIEHTAEAYNDNADRVRALERSGLLREYFEEPTTTLEA